MPRKSPLEENYKGTIVVVLGAGAFYNVGFPLYAGLSAEIQARDPKARALEKVQAGERMKATLLAREAQRQEIPAILLWCRERRQEGQTSLVIITMNVCGTAHLCGGTVLQVHGDMHQERCCLCEAPDCDCGPQFQGPAIRWDGEPLPLERAARATLGQADTVLVLGTSDCCLSIWEWMADAERSRSDLGKSFVVYHVDPRPTRPPRSPPVHTWTGNTQDFVWEWSKRHVVETRHRASGLATQALRLIQDERRKQKRPKTRNQRKDE